ncbi:MAG: UDP-N-acetylmuramate dehydrogenase [bacterium]|nr:UDP-N-acetylmuramate dehydrogenase [bacterium]
MEIQEQVSLAQYTTFHIGGSARYLALAQDIQEVRECLSFAKEKNLGVLILGGGSNILVHDIGFGGLVIKIELSGIELQKNGNEVLFVAGAGASWDALVARAVQENLWGIENLSGIPGTVGAAPVQNIGAYGVELKDTLVWVEALDVETKEAKKFTNTECNFGYRTSVFKKNPGRYVVLRVALALDAHGTPNLAYRDLSEAFIGVQSPTLGQIRDAVLAIRSRKFPDLTQEGTAGSFFLNPIVSVEKATELATQFPTLPQFTAEGGVKISLAWLLDNALGLKGARVGGARLFERQPLVIVAQKNTSSRDITELAEKVQKEVKEKLRIEIEPEVKIL